MKRPPWGYVLYTDRRKLKYSQNPAWRLGAPVMGGVTRLCLWYYEVKRRVDKPLTGQ